MKRPTIWDRFRAVRQAWLDPFAIGDLSQQLVYSAARILSLEVMLDVVYQRKEVLRKLHEIAGKEVWYVGQSYDEPPFIVVGIDHRQGDGDCWIIDGPPRSENRLRRVHKTNLKTKEGVSCGLPVEAP